MGIYYLYTYKGQQKKLKPETLLPKAGVRPAILPLQMAQTKRNSIVLWFT